jgi:flavodoxin
MSEKKILVVYYSRDGHTERVAKDIAERLNADIEAVIDQKSRKGLLGWLRAARDAKTKRTTTIGNIEKNPADYEFTIIGTPVWAGSMTPAVRTYINKFKGSFKNSAYFVLSGGMPPDNVVKSMEELAGKAMTGFVGFFQKNLKKKEAYEEKIKNFVSLF